MTALKTVTMFLRAAKTEAEETGESTEGMASSVSKLRDELYALTKQKVDIQIDEDNFKSTYQIMKELSEVWGELTDITQANILKLIGGKRNSNVVMSLLENFDVAEEVMKSIANAAGSALVENEKYLDSIQGKISQFKATFQELGMTLIGSDFTKEVVNIGTVILNILNILAKGIDAVGGLNTVLLVTVGIIATIKADAIWGLIKALPKAFVKLLWAVIDFNKNLLHLSEIWSVVGSEAEAEMAGMSKMSVAFHALGISASTAQIAIGAFTAVLTAAIIIYQKVKQAEEERRQAAIDSANAASDESNEIVELTNRYLSLNEAIKTDVSVYEELTSAKDALLSKLDIESKRVEDLAGKYASLTDKIRAATVISLQDSERDIRGGLAALEKELVDAVAQDLFFNGSLDTFHRAMTRENVEADDKALSALYDAGIPGLERIYSKPKEKLWGMILSNTGDYDLSTVNGAINTYERLAKMLDIVSAAAGSQNDVYEALYAEYNRVQGAVEDYKAGLESLNSVLAEQYVTQGLIGEKAPTTQEEFEQLRNDIIDKAVKSGEFSGTRDDVIAAIDSAMALDAQLSEYMDELERQEALVEEIQRKKQFIAEMLISKDYKEGTIAYSRAFDKLGGMSDKEIEFVYSLVVNDNIQNLDDAQKELEEFRLSKAINRTDIREYVASYNDYINLVKSAKLLGADMEKTIYGNIDTNNRKILEWTDANLTIYKDALESWGATVDEMRGSFSTVFGTSEEFGGVEIAFSPILQTDDGAVLLNRDTVDAYIDGLIDKAGEGWSAEDLFRLDTEGLDIDGQHIEKLLADIGETANQTAQVMHFVGDTGAVADAYAELEAVADKYHVSVETLFAVLNESFYATANDIRTALSDLFNAKDFEGAKGKLTELANTVGGISPEAIIELAKESTQLAAILDEDGMNAQFLAKVLEQMVRGNDGLALITGGALELNEALDGMVDMFDDVTEAKLRYDAAMSTKEKDTDFKSYAAAFKALDEQFKSGFKNSNTFWAAAEFLFGSEQLAMWGWSDGLDQIHEAMEKNRQVFSDADDAGAGFIQRLYEMSEAGKMVDENGEKLLEISRDAAGAYNLDIDPNNLDEIAKKMNMTREAVLACLEALSMWGDVNFYDLTEVMQVIGKIGLAVETAGGKAINLERLIEQLMTLGKTEKEVNDICSALSQLDGVVLLNVSSDVDTLTNSLEQLGVATNDGTTISVNYESLANLMSGLGCTKKDAEGVIDKLSELDNISFTNAKGEVKGLEDALLAISLLKFSTVEGSVQSVEGAVDNVNESSTDNVVSELDSIGESADEVVTKVYSIGEALDGINGKECVVYYSVKRKKSILESILSGFAGGTNNAPKTEALVGEEAPELIQSGDKAYLAGIGGPEIVRLDRGDRVYTAAETRKILNSSRKKIIGSIPAYQDGRGSGKASEKINGRFKASGLMPVGGSVNVTPTVNVDGTALEESLKDTLEKLKDEIDSIIKDFEHSIFLLEKNGGSSFEIVAVYHRMQEAVHAQAEKYRELGLDENSDYIQELQKQWWEYADSIKQVEQQAVDGLIDVVKTASSVVDEVQKVYDVLHEAANEYAASGYISIDSLQAIIDLGPQYMQLLMDENGQLVINEERINAVIAARTQQLALESAMTYIERIRLALQKDSAENLNDLLYVTADATDATWGLVYAELALMHQMGDLDDAQYNAAYHNIQALQSLANNAIDGIRITAETSVEALNDMKAGLDDILKYVMDMLKQRINDQIEALEDMKDAYRDIIELRKEALEAAREEADYQDEVAEKIKEIAKLQERVNALSLDDSRDARAQKARLEEEMYALQNELADKQSDYAINAQQDALDSMSEAYAQEKDGEIAVLRESISSYQKLYDMA